MSLDELLSCFADALDQERMGRWKAGDIIVTALKQAGNRRARGKLLRTFASFGHCSTATVRWMAEVSASFEEGMRYPEVNDSFYRAVLRAGRRTDKAPVEILATALKEGWHVSKIEQLGRAPQAEHKAAGRCQCCGAAVSVRVMLTGRDGFAIPCPVCVVMAWNAGHDSREVDRVAVLA